jgi:hypothetical protein
MLICRGPSVWARLVLPNADFQRDNCAPFASHIEGLKDVKGFRLYSFVVIYGLIVSLGKVGQEGAMMTSFSGLPDSLQSFGYVWPIISNHGQ